ncbi:MAG: ABC transporter ATP-binding protein [Saprospiraceae bacterium]|nr:ABC transporter ATP-binding protein [Saprospiraceae bacterium]
MIQVDNVTKSYGALQVLKGVSLQIAAGEIVAIVGKSGAGKSTLLHIVGTLDGPDSGSLSINGKIIKDLKGNELAAFRNTTIGFVFQFHHLLPEFTALENVMLPGLIAHGKKSKAMSEAKDLLHYMGLADRLEHKPTELSGGEQQRVAIARALVNKPNIILADEPTGNLDTATSKELHELFLQLRKDFGQTFLIVTHNPELSGLADRCLIMGDGRFIEKSEL